MKRQLLILFSAVLLPMGILALTATQAAEAAKPSGPALTWAPSGSYDFETLTSGTKSATFTLSYSSKGAGASGDVTVAVSGSGFSMPTNGCAGKSLRDGASCTVSVQYRFTTAGETNTGTLSATTRKLSATVALSGASASSAPKLTIAPGNPPVTAGSSNYEWYWGTGNYVGNDSGAVHYGPGYDQWFTITNEGDSAVTIAAVSREILSEDAGTFGGYTYPGGYCASTTIDAGASCSWDAEQAAGTCVQAAAPDQFSRLRYAVKGADETVYATLTVYGQFICW